MTEKQLKLKAFYEDKANWRPPSYSQIARYMGWKSKRSASEMLKRIYSDEDLSKMRHGSGSTDL